MDFLDDFQRWKARVGERVRTIRTAQKLSQAEFAARVGLKGGEIGKIERGGSPLTGKVALQIEQQFGVPAAVLYGEELPQLLVELTPLLHRLTPDNRRNVLGIVQVLLANQEPEPPRPDERRGSA